MATDLSDVVKQGYLRCKSRSLGVWQKRWLVLRSTSSKGPCRLEKYVDEKAARSVDQHKVQLLTNVAAVTRLPPASKKHAFTIDFHDGSSKSFACDSELEADNWVKQAIQECFLPSSGISNGEPDILKPGIQKELQEQFRVILMPCTKLPTIRGECLLQVTHENIYLWDINNSKLKLCAWPLTALRRYGSDMTKFTFEAGRHCETGEGMFLFYTKEGEKIYKKVHQATLAIAEAHQRMKKHTIPSLAKENSFKSCPEYRFTPHITDLMTSFDEAPSDASQEHVSWYHSDNDSDVTASASEVYSHRRIDSAPFSIDHSSHVFQAAN